MYIALTSLYKVFPVVVSKHIKHAKMITLILVTNNYNFIKLVKNRILFLLLILYATYNYFLKFSFS